MKGDCMPAFKQLQLRSTLVPFAAAALTASVIAAAALAPMAARSQAQPAPAATSAPLVTGLPDFSVLVERAGPSVVNIRTTEKLRAGAMSSQEEEMQEFFRRFFGMPMPSPNPRQLPQPRGPRGGGEEREVPRGVGSGFVISADGYIMTNAHVVADADEIYVTLTDKREFKGKVIGADQRTDVAIVKIEANGLPALRMGDVGRLKVGEWVVAIGSPFGLENTVTAGIVSAKQRETGDFLPFIQTDVAVNPGNSGGPLLNLRGEVVGINSQIYSRTGTFAGVSFAIPIDEAMRVGEQLRSSGRVSRGRLGVLPQDVSKELAESMGLPKAQGAILATVEKDGPADKAGLEPGDVVTKIDNRNVENATDLRRVIGGMKPGSSVNVEYWRKGKTRTTAIKLGELEPVTVAQRSPRGGDNGARPDAQAAPFGLVVRDLTDQQKRDLRVRGGVSVEAVDGAAASAGIRRGDVIIAVQDSDIADAKQFEQVVKALPKDRAARMLVRRGEMSQWVIVRGSSK
jgi:serine protease Do